MRAKRAGRGRASDRDTQLGGLGGAVSQAGSRGAAPGNLFDYSPPPQTPGKHIRNTLLFEQITQLLLYMPWSKQKKVTNSYSCWPQERTIEGQFEKWWKIGGHGRRNQYHLILLYLLESATGSTQGYLRHVAYTNSSYFTDLFHTCLTTLTAKNFGDF